MKNCIRILCLSVLAILVLLPEMVWGAPQYYRKHIVLVVDQTPKTSAGGYLKPVGDALLSFLNGADVKQSYLVPSQFSFDSSEDLIEVFTYGLEGNIANPPYNGPAYKLLLQSKSNISNDMLFQNTLKDLVHPYKSAVEFGDLNSWWQSELDEVFATTTPLAQSIKANSGFGFSAFLPNAVIPFINKSVPAQEYYIICVSTFQAGLTAGNAAFDINILASVYGGNQTRADAFYSWLNKYAAPYVVSDWLNISEGTVASKGVSAIGKKFVLESAAHTSVNINSNIKLTQHSFGGKVFSIEPLTVTFPKNENLDIDKVVLEINNGNETYQQVVENYTYDDYKKQYVLTPMDIKFANKVSQSSNLEFKVVFTPKQDKNTDLLPFVFIATRDITGSDIVFKSAPTLLYIGLAVAFLLLVVALYLVYLSRAKLAKNRIKLNVWPISNSRFMDVSDNKVTNYDCWYYRDGEKEKNIQVSGSIVTEYPKYAKKNRLVAEYRIEDVDLNEDFSFRPDGYLPNGDVRRANQWYPLKLDQNGDFEFEVTSYLEDNLPSPDFTREDQNVLRLKVIVRTHFEDKEGKVVGDYNQVEKRYHFIVRPEIENSDIWVSLDPGTSGSCIAYGWGGLPADTNNIHLAKSHSTDTAGNDIISPIFYSKIQIMDHSDIFDGKKPEELVVFDSDAGKGDFRFGNEAHIFWGRNSFQSIKKLLGYTNELEVKNPHGKIATIKGEDLAHLLIKGLCREFEKFIQTDVTVSPYIKGHLIHNGRLTPSRAIVAVPNNYTVNKVQAMVNTIKRTHLFKEVHYVFEAEGVMMYFINQNWSKLASLADKTFVVFDMGGATINATSFRIEVNSAVHDGSVYTRSIIVDTVSRVGYTVGGDNIDFALINIILDIPSIKQALINAGVKKDEFMRKQKKRLILFAQKLKLDYIDSVTGNLREGNWAKDSATLWTQVYKMLDNDCHISCPDALDEKDVEYLKSSKAKGIMRKMVLDCVEDAIKELVTDGFSSEIVLILSGRSILYPRIKEKVEHALSTQGFTVSEWNYNGVSNKEEIVKTAVVRGACWYAMNSKYVELRHDSVTSTFGYTDQINQEVKYVPVIDKNTSFDENGEVERTVVPKDPTINTIKFVQMLGSNFDEIYNSPELLHKMAELTQVSQSHIRGNVKSIKIKVDSNNNFSYEINVAGEPRPISGTCKATDADITDTNSEAYAFAALSSLEDELVSQNDTAPSINLTKRTNRKSGVGRF